MSKVKNLLLKSRLHLIAIIVIYIGLIFTLDNKNIMIIKMESNPSTILESEFYYTKTGIAFNDSKMSRRYKEKNGYYYFKLPSFSQIDFARFDPSKWPIEIKIDNINIISTKWFKTRVYSLDVKKSKIVSQIADFKTTKSGVKFKTTGKDGQLALNFNLTKINEYTTYHLDTLLISFLLYLILLYLKHIYKNEEITDKLIAKLTLYAIFLAFSIFKVDYYKEHIHYNYTPDIIAHLSYIEHIHKNREIMPNFRDMYMITNANAGNYLGHPPLYYHLMNTIYNKKLSLMENLDNFRLLNEIIFAFSIMLLLYLGFSAKLSILGDFVYLSILTSIPMHAYLGSTINNDNLAILGGIIFIIGLKKILEKNFSNSSYIILGAGIFIAFFAKLTAGILVFFASIFFVIYSVAKKEYIQITKQQILIVLSFLLPTIIYQIYILQTYHALAPTLNITHPKEYLSSVYYVPKDQRVYLNAFEWFINYMNNFRSGWFGIHSHHSLIKQSIFDFIGLLAFHIIALVALFSKCSKSHNSYCKLGKIVLLALIAVGVTQYSFSFNAHLKSGYMGGLQARYLLPFMFAFAIMATLYIEKFKNNFWVVIGIIALCIQTLYSDFFYFLRYYI
jgi:hypothetical protein